MNDAKQPSVADLCREWSRINAKLAYDLAALPETTDVDTDRLVDEANRRIFEIEEVLAASAPATPDEAHDVLGIVLKNMREEHMGEDRDRGMVSAVRKALVHFGKAAAS